VEERKAPRKSKPQGIVYFGLLTLGALYLVGVWLEGVGSALPREILPRAPLYFLQIAALFPRAATNVIDYRIEAWLCKERTWRELDPRAYFPLDPDDKENRFQRVMHFHREDRTTMNALDDYVVTRHKSGGLAAPDGIDPSSDIGGIRVLSLRLPIPEAGSHFERMRRDPLSSYPESVRKNFYWTKASKRAARCGYSFEPKEKAKERARPYPEDEGPEKGADP
jgi:hypothetical protein